MTATGHQLVSETDPARFQSQSSEWRSVKLKYSATKIGSGKTPKGGNEVYTTSGVIFLRSQNVYDDGLRLDDVAFIDEAVDREMYQTRVQPGDVLLNITGASIGRTCIVPQDLPPANVNQHVCIIRPIAGADPQFLGFALKSSVVKDQVGTLENGSSREGLNYEQVGNLIVRLPPAKEHQQAIAAFLDRKTAAIDALIAKKQRMIELLHEKRQALIGQAVTKGLDPNVKAKDSGIPWLGSIPAHWQVRRLKYLVSGAIEQGWSPQCENQPADIGEWGVLKVGCVNGEDFDSDEQKALPLDLQPEVRYEIRSGDILISRGNTRELVGSAALLRTVRPRLLLCDLLYRLRANAVAIDPEFLILALRSRFVRFQIEREATGTSSSMKKISQDDIRNFWICVPPLLEQHSIARAVSEEWQRSSKMRDCLQQQMDKLHEYRQTLISAAVTGKINVTKEVA